MMHILDTDGIPVADRRDAVRQTIADTVVPVNIDFPTARPASVRGEITGLGDLTVCSIRSNAVTVERTAALARDELPPRIFLGVQLAGSSLIVQGDREAVLRPGDLAFSESTSAYTLVDGQGIQQHFFSVPVAALGLPPDMIRRLSATVLCPGLPLSDLAGTYLRRLGDRPELTGHPGAYTAGPPTIDLIRSLLTTHRGADTARAPSQASLPLRILEYVRRHLGDPDLDAARVAAAHHISVRHLYNVLAGEGILLGDWIRTQRLEHCRTALSCPGPAPIGALARRWGFRSASSFGRSFRSAYGTSPREWRDRAAG
ncbi:AraC-like DNA-binding protein [Actinoplanes lutulentus]|uniref:AraC-like DNA-binding protein n=1 Tax=Actinoplanes lutulentus TaxID=1287878 RepID=A0A327YYQ9_9ACTN|nr:helix-turn-helix domain-containing protein [Actinoplanes lutulentus]MBB2943438.1 AraC-like DNA-binding protein [Actinoplanes lutulentus]RAK26043.1 AraC-like DNA-binding protein [Actinoplanes lutulentus]